MILHVLCILHKISTVKGAPEELVCHQIVSQAASQRHVILRNFPQSKIWSMTLQAQKSVSKAGANVCLRNGLTTPQTQNTID